MRYCFRVTDLKVRAHYTVGATAEFSFFDVIMKWVLNCDGNGNGKMGLMARREGVHIATTMP